MLNYNLIEVNDSTYAYTISGSGEPLVLLHGFTGSSVTWKKYIATWRETYKVITIDLPGHGKTAIESGKSMREFAKDLSQIFNRLQIDTAHLLGYSMGGRAALAFTIEYPELVRSLILESASPGIEGSVQRLERQEADEKLAKRINTMGINKFVAEWENIALFDSQKSLPIPIQETIRQERMAQTASGLSQSLLHMGTGTQDSQWDKLAGITLPVLLIVGEYDKKFVELNELMVKLMRTAEIITVLDAGHAVHVEKMEKFAMIVSKFITHNT